MSLSLSPFSVSLDPFHLSFFSSSCLGCRSSCLFRLSGLTSPDSAAHKLHGAWLIYFPHVHTPLLNLSLLLFSVTTLGLFAACVPLWGPRCSEDTLNWAWAKKQSWAAWCIAYLVVISSGLRDSCISACPFISRASLNGDAHIPP